MSRLSGRLLACLAVLTAGALGFSGALEGGLSDREGTGPQRQACPLPPRPREPPSKPVPVEVLSLEPGVGPWRRLLPEKPVHLYRFDLKKEEHIRLEFLQEGVDALIEVRDPDGDLWLWLDTLNGKRGPEDVPFVAARPGIHEVLVKRLSAGEGDPLYRPRILAKRTARPGDHARAGAARTFSRASLLRDAGAPPKELEQWYGLAFEQARDAGDRFRTADSAYELGRLLKKAGDWRGARNAYTAALPVYEELSNRRQELVVHNNLGIVLERLNDLKGAKEHYQAAIGLAEDLEDWPMWSNAWLQLGLLESELGETAAALDCFERAGERVAGEGEALFALLNARGSVLARMGLTREAMVLHLQALRIARKSKAEGLRARALVHIADVYREAGNTRFAVAFYKRALANRAIEREDQASAINNLGLTYYDAGRFEEALALYEDAIAKYERWGMREELAVALTNLGLGNNALGRPALAVRAFSRALPIASDLEYRPTEAAIRFGMAWSEGLRKNPRQAVRLAEEAVELIEDLRISAQQQDLQIFFLAKREAFYSLWIDLLMEQNALQPGAGFDHRAFEVAERYRARALLERLEERERRPFPVSTLPEIQKELLDPQTVLLAFAFGERRTYGWVITPTRVEDFPLPEKKRLQELIRNALSAILKSHRSEERASAATAAAELGTALFGPVAGRIRGKRLLIIAPPELLPLPFAALPDPARTQEKSPHPGWPVPMVLDHEIVVSPSASVLAALRQIRAERKLPQGRLALVYDPIYEPSDERLLKALGGRRPAGDPLRGQFGRLSHAEEEIERILEVTGTEDVLLLEDFEANRERLLDPQGEAALGDSGIVHFSVHGQLDERDFKRSSLVLSAFDREGAVRDPFLTAQDVEGMDLPVDLIVLNACRTGLGRKVPGEGLVGLSRAFLSAGASRVVATLWDVEGLPAPDLMPVFYDRLLNGNLSPAAALREAQIAMWGHPRWNAPYHWGGFALVGEWSK